jgi:F0F1-type ATP synthase assembly protein I
MVTKIIKWVLTAICFLIALGLMHEPKLMELLIGLLIVLGTSIQFYGGNNE